MNCRLIGTDVFAEVNEGFEDPGSVATELYLQIQCIRISSARGPRHGQANTHVVATEAWIGNGSFTKHSQVSVETVVRSARITELWFLSPRDQVSAAQANIPGSWFHVVSVFAAKLAPGESRDRRAPVPALNAGRRLHGLKDELLVEAGVPGTLGGGDWCGEAPPNNRRSISRVRWLFTQPAIQAVGFSLGFSMAFNTMDLRFLMGISAKLWSTALSVMFASNQ